MALQKYHTYNGGEPETYPNGSVAHYGRTMFGRHLAKITACPMADGSKPRTVYIQGEADTFFSIPAAISIRGKTVRGWISFETDSGFMFNRDKTAD